MTATSLMSLGTQALSAAYSQLHTTSNNIANANTAGYSRQTAQLANRPSMSTSSGYLGMGVSVTTVLRASNQFLTEQASALKSVSAGDQQKAVLLKQLEQVFPSGQNGLGQAATQIFNAFSDLAAAPADLSARQAVLGRLDSLASLVRSASAQLDSLQANVSSDLSGSVAEVNGLAQQLALLNAKINEASATGHSPNELLDQRDLLVGHIAEHMDLSTVLAPDGSVSVFVANGQTLVLGSHASKLVVRTDPLDASRLTVGIVSGGKLVQEAEQSIGGGRIGGLLNFQSTDLADARARLGQFVAGMASALNSQQARGIDLNGAAGAAVFSAAPPRAEAARGNARDSAGAPLSSIQLEVVEVTALKASDYRLKADPANAGQYILTRQSDGLVRSGLVSGDVVDGLRISNGPVVPASGEQFLLRSVSQAASTLQVMLRDPRGLAASNPMTATGSAANTGTLAVTGLRMVADPTLAQDPVTIRFTDDNGNYEVLGPGGTLRGSGSFVSGEPIVWNGSALSLNGVPRSGDQLSLVRTTHPQGNNGNALAFDALASTRLVDGQTVTDAYAALFSNIGVRTQGAVTAANNTALAHERATSALANEVGVNIDEEAARLIQYQQSYQASAKLLTTAQSMIDTLLAAVGR